MEKKNVREEQIGENERETETQKGRAKSTTNENKFTTMYSYTSLS